MNSLRTFQPTFHPTSSYGTDPIFSLPEKDQSSVSIPLEPFLLPAHSLHMLILMRVRFEQHERRVRRQDDVVFGVLIRAAAILNTRVFGKLSIWHSSPIIFFVIANFIVLVNETCFMCNQPSHEMKCESMPIIFYITSVAKDLKNFTSRRFGSRFI